MYHKFSEKNTTPTAPTQKLQTQYPSEWFRKHENTKPTVPLTLLIRSLADSRKMVWNAIKNSNLNVSMATNFLHYYFSTIEEKLDEYWKSFGVTIGEKDTIITPISLLQINPTNAIKDFTGGDAASGKADKWMAIYICSIYRLIRAKLTDYRTQISNRINEQIKAANEKGAEVSEVIDMYSGWANDKAFNALIAAADMFFHKFPLNPAANIRIGTTGSRFKDCAGIISYGYMIDLTGMKEMITLMDWVFVVKIGDEIERMMKEGEELEDPYSYFPYQVDLDLVNKSSYSASANPHFFERVHIAGALLRSTRSINARHIHEGQSMNILLNAGCMAYVYSHNFEVTKVFASDLQDFAKDDDDDDDSELESASAIIKNAVKSKDPKDWVKMLNSTDNQMPDVVRDYIKNVARKIKDPREGTIDAHISEVSKTLQ